jgi:hypothetical protein
MAPRSQSDLVKIGLEGFALIDEYQRRLQKIGYEASSILEGYDPRTGKPSSPPARQPPAVPRQGPKQDCIYQYQRPEALVYHMRPASAIEGVMNSYDAMIMHEGVLIVDYSKKKSTAMAY